MQEEGQTNDLKTIFASFDIDKNGTIQLGEIAAIAQKLGQKMSEQETNEVMKLLDLNGDGKINFEEFEYWWLTGKKGKMIQLVYLKAEALKMTKFLSDAFSESGVNLQNHKGSDKPDKFDFLVEYGQKSDDSIAFNFQTYILGEEKEKLINKMKIFVPELDENAFGIILKLPSENASQAKNKFDRLLKELISEIGLPIEDIQQNSIFGYKSILTQSDLIVYLQAKEQMKKVSDPVTKKSEYIFEQLGENFYSKTEVSFAVNATVNDILEEQLAGNLLKGFNLNIHQETNKSALKKLRKLTEKLNKNSNSLMTLLTLMRSTKFHLKIKTPEQLDRFLDKLGIKEIAESTPLLKDILEQLSPEIIERVQQIPPLKLIKKLSKFALQNVSNHIQLFLIGSKFSASHLSFKAKNITKVHSIIFNEI